MADEEIQQQEEVEELDEEQELEAPVLPAPPVEQPNEWKGRLEKMQAALEEKGYRYDPAVNDFVPVSQSGYYPTTGQQQYAQPPPQQEEEFDYEPASYKKLVEDGVRQGIQELMCGLLPILDGVVETTTASAYNDWNDIKSDVLSEARQFGYTSLTALKTNPQALELFVHAARGKRQAQAPPTPQVPPGPTPEDIARQQAILAASGVGASGGGAPTAPQKLSAEERAEAKALNVTEDAYRNLRYGPATIGGGNG